MTSFSVIPHLLTIISLIGHCPESTMIECKNSQKILCKGTEDFTQFVFEIALLVNLKKKQMLHKACSIFYIGPKKLLHDLISYSELLFSNTDGVQMEYK